MILVRSPLRISFAGGGSDLPAYCNHHIGHVVSATIDKYVYIAVDYRYDGKIRLSYSKTEFVDKVSDIEHDIARETFIDMGVISGIDVVSLADLPYGSGLGSSGAFTTALLLALYTYYGRVVNRGDLARDASYIEMVRCGKPIGYQDQTASAYGGVNLLGFYRDGHITATDLWNVRYVSDLEQRILLVDTGQQGPSSDVLSRQAGSIEGDSRARASVQAMSNLALAFADSLSEGLIDNCGSIVDASWAIKKSLDEHISSGHIDDIYHFAKDNGAIGGKLCGAGGRGMLLLICKKGARQNLSDYIHSKFSLRTILPHFSPQGAQVVWSSR